METVLNFILYLCTIGIVVGFAVGLYELHVKLDCIIKKLNNEK